MVESSEKGRCRPACCSSHLPISPESEWRSELRWKILVCVIDGACQAGKSKSHPAGNPDRLKEALSSIWKGFSFDLTQVGWGVLAGCAHVAPITIRNPSSINSSFVALDTALSHSSLLIRSRGIWFSPTLKRDFFSSFFYVFKENGWNLQIKPLA